MIRGKCQSPPHRRTAPHFCLPVKDWMMRLSRFRGTAYKFPARRKFCHLEPRWVRHGHHHNGDQAARRPHILCLLDLPFTNLGLWQKCTIVNTALFHRKEMYSQMCLLTFSWYLQPFGCNLKAGLFDSRFRGYGDVGVGDRPIR